MECYENGTWSLVFGIKWQDVGTFLVLFEETGLRNLKTTSAMPSKILEDSK
jgi:hypothetical protein